jgi:hypothetical protein
MDELSLFIPITKIDAAKRLVYGIVAAEKPDAAKEICDYESTKPLYQRWSDGFVKATDGKSLGNLRTMHGNVAAGKVVELSFDDAAKRIQICGKVVDDGEWTKVEEGVYTGFSQGGKYIKRWPDPGDSMLTRYTAEPLEVSLVDNLCLPDATFSVIKADGTTELRKFKHSNPDNDHGHVVVQKSGDAPNDNEVGEQVWINSRLQGRTFKRKADLRQALRSRRRRGRAENRGSGAGCARRHKGQACQNRRRWRWCGSGRRQAGSGLRRRRRAKVGQRDGHHRERLQHHAFHQGDRRCSEGRHGLCVVLGRFRFGSARRHHHDQLRADHGDGHRHADRGVVAGGRLVAE